MTVIEQAVQTHFGTLEPEQQTKLIQDATTVAQTLEQTGRPLPEQLMILMVLSASLDNLIPKPTPT